MGDGEALPVDQFVEVNPRSVLSGMTVPYVSMEDLSENGRLLHVGRRDISMLPGGQATFKDHDILIAKITPCFENGKGAYVLGLDGEVACGSTEFHVLRCRSGVNPKYIYHWTRSKKFRRAAEAMMTGSAGQRRVPAEFFSRFCIPEVSMRDQHRISEALDASIDMEIQLEREISKAQVVRAALLSRIKTGAKGEKVAIGEVASISSGSTPSRSQREYWQDGTVPWVRSGEVDFSTVYGTKERLSKVAISSGAVRLHPAGTILVAMYGEGVTRGRCAILGIEAAVNQAIAAIQCTRRLHQRYLYYWLEASYRELRSAGQGSNQSNLNADTIAALEISIPSKSDQQQFVESIAAWDDYLITCGEELAKCLYLKDAVASELLGPAKLV